jgi:hypothetical protein
MLARLLCVVSVGLVMSASALGAEPKDLVGKYTIKGTYVPDKSKYEGTAEIEFKIGKIVIITAKYDKFTAVGVGKVDGDTIRVTFERARVIEEPYLCNFKIMKDGSLVTEYEYGKEKWREVFTRTK